VSGLGEIGFVTADAVDVEASSAVGGEDYDTGGHDDAGIGSRARLRTGSELVGPRNRGLHDDGKERKS
jgi:hypothetical protein